MSTRLKLENLIFWRAAHLHVTVLGKNGHLLTTSQDAFLQALLQIYNGFFSSQNQRTFKEITRCLWLDYLMNQLPFQGGLIPFQESKNEIEIERYFTSLLKQNIDKKNKL